MAGEDYGKDGAGQEEGLDMGKIRGSSASLLVSDFPCYALAYREVLIEAVKDD